MNRHLLNNILGDVRDNGRTPILWPELLPNIKRIAERAGLSDAHNVWVCLRKADHFGRGVMHIGDYDVRVIPQGEGIFWHESTKDDGRLFLLRPSAVIARLEKILDSEVRNVPDGEAGDTNS